MKDFIVLLRITLFWAVMRQVDPTKSEPTTNLHCVTSQKREGLNTNEHLQNWMSQ